jgi:hypothetical protein
MTIVRRVCVLLAAVACAVPAAVAGPDVTASGAGSVRATPAQASAPTLVRIRAAHHSGFDRVVFEFRGGVPSSRQVTYVPRLVEDASGLPVRIAGRALLKVRMEPAQAHDDSGNPTAPLRLAVALPNVMNVVRAGDFEAVTTYGIGLAKRTPFTVFTLTKPSRLVIDIGAAFPTVQRKVYFLDEPRFVANTPPFFVPVLRPVLPGTPATGVMDRIFAGPVAREEGRGLRLLRSQATGFTRLGVQAGVARVQLVGGCSSGGSTVTIAGEIMPSLRQFPTVDFVKIYDPAGRTERPTGRVDSIPECLEP